MSSTVQGQAPSPLPPDKNRGPMLLAIIRTTTVLDIIIVVMRMFSRWVFKIVVGWDDYTILMAMVGLPPVFIFAGLAEMARPLTNSLQASTIYGSIIISLQVRSGFGRHTYYLDDNQIREAVKWTTLSTIQNPFGVYFVRISACFFILRIISSTHKAMSRVIYAFMVVLTLLCLATVFLLCLRCIPIEGIWNPTVHSRCLPPRAVIQSSIAFSGKVPTTVLANIAKVDQAFGTATDFLCVILPMFVVGRLQMELRTKLSLSALLALSLFTAACSIGKTVLIEIGIADPTWSSLPVEIWANLEQNLGILVVSLPTVRRLFTTDVLLSASARFGIRSSQKTTSRCSRKDVFDRKKSDADNLVPLESILALSPLDDGYENIQSTSQSEVGPPVVGLDDGTSEIVR